MGKKHKSISYAKWGYIFIIPFFVVYAVCTLVPLFSTFLYSFFDYYTTMDFRTVGPNFVGLQNYIDMFTPDRTGAIDLFNYTGNTLLMWVMGAVPQVLFALVLALIFTGIRLRIKGQSFFKTVIYMPNLIMASAFSMLFFTLFSPVGPVNQILTGITGAEPFLFFSDIWATRSIIAFINFLMWFGNTTILLMAGIMGIDQSLFEASSIDGATSKQTFFRITLPLLVPIIVYVLVTALIGGLQMYDVPQIMTNGKGGVDMTAQTLVMQLNRMIGGVTKNYGKAGALSAYIFIVTGALSILVFKVTGNNSGKKKAKKGGK